MKIEMLAGLEVETVYNMRALGNLQRSGYHESHKTMLPFNKDFFLENDGSLDCEDENGGSYFDAPDTVELISNPFKIQDSDELIDGLKESFIKLNKKLSDNEQRVYCSYLDEGGYDEEYDEDNKNPDVLVRKVRSNELSSFLNFNESTGCHIHFSILKRKQNQEYIIKDRNQEMKFRAMRPFLLKGLVTLELLKSINERIQQKVTYQLPHLSKKFNDYFYREYAQEMQTLEQGERTRYSSYNLGVKGDEHIEFRSFHLRGVEKWSDMKKLIKIALTTIYEMIDEVVQKEIKKQYPCVIDKVLFNEVVTNKVLPTKESKYLTTESMPTQRKSVHLRRIETKPKTEKQIIIIE